MFGFGKKKSHKPQMPEGYNVNTLGLEAAWPQSISDFFDGIVGTSKPTPTPRKDVRPADLDVTRIYGYPPHTL